MHTLYVVVAVSELVLIGALLVRVARGPSVCDRIVALNTISTLAAIAILFFAAFADRVIYLDPAVWMASFSYLGALVWARYLERGVAVTEVIVIALCVIGLFVTLSGVVGILRMPDVYTRIQCSSKTITLGALPLLVALAIGEGPVSTYGSRALIVAFLLLLVNPAASHALARAAYKTGVPMWDGAVVDEAAERRQNS